MKLLDMLRSSPDWESTDPSTRLSAVRDLVDDDGTQQLLLQIARDDDDPSVRREAVVRITDLGSLVGIIQSDTDGAVRTAAQGVIRDLAIEAEDPTQGELGVGALSDEHDLIAAARTARLESVSRAALLQLTDQRALGSVARRATRGSIAREALAKLDALDEIQSVAVKTDDKTIALLAFNRLTDEGHLTRDVLEQLGKRAKQKTVQRRARAALLALDALTEPATPTDHDRLCDELASVARETDLDRGRNAMDRLLEQWANLDGAPETDVTRRFSAAREAAEARLAKLEASTVAARPLASVDPAPQVPPTEGSPQARDTDKPETPELANAERKDADKEEAAKKRCAKREAEAEALQRIQQRSRTLEGLIASENIGLAEGERQLRAARRLLDRPEVLLRRDRDEALRKLRQAHTKLLGRVRELRDFADWRRWANLGIQESLCGRMEALAEVSNDEIVAPFRDIMSRWRQASDVSKDRGKALWLRFKEAHDVVYPRYQQQLDKQVVERGENLVKLTAFVEEAERLANSNDWLKTVRRITDLQAEWKSVGAAPRKQQRQLWTRFRSACNTFFSRRKADLVERKQQWAENQTRKEKLCQAVEALVESDDLPAAMAEVKRAQATWKTIGPVRRSRSNAMWQRFRMASEAVFGRAHEKERAVAAERVAVLEALCVEVEAALAAHPAASSAAGLGEKISELQQRWRDAPETPPNVRRTMSTRFGKALLQLAAAHPDTFRGTDLDQTQRLKRLEKLCERIEAIRSSADPGQADASPAEILASQWRDTLASNLMGVRVDEAAERRAAADEVKRARQDYKRIGAVPGDEARKLAGRFQEACALVLAWASPGKQA